MSQFIRLFKCKAQLLGAIFILLCNSAWSQQIVTGKIRSATTQEPLIGATVLLKGATNGATTDANGKYTIKVNNPNGAVLVVSYLSFTTKEVDVMGRQVVDVELEEDIKQLDEVVVVGYGAIKKKELTGAVSSVVSKDVAAKGVISPLEAMQGQVAGVDISASSGRAGTSFKISIRGQNSLVSQNALYVVDGIVTDNIDFLNPQDIQQIDILKDAASTAIYGSRGSNGVVIVTTKRADTRKGKGATVTYDGYFGIRESARMPDFMDGREWWRFRQNNFISNNMKVGKTYSVEIPGHPGELAAIGDGLVTIGTGGAANTLTSQVLYDRVKNGQNTDWPSYFLRTGFQQNHYLSISGQSGNDISYLLGVGYQTEKGNVKKEQMDKYNIKASLESKLSDKWSAGLSLNIALTEKEIGSETVLQQAFRMNPLLTPYSVAADGDPNYPYDGMLVLQPGKYAGINFTSTVNPLLDLAESNDNTRHIQGLGNVYVQFSPASWMSVKSTFAPSFYTNRRGRSKGSNTEANKGGNPTADLSRSEYFSTTWDNQVNISKKINNHSLGLMGLVSMYTTRLESDSTFVYNLPYDSEFYNLGSAQNIESVSSNYVKTTMLSYVARLNYSYKEKYLVTLSTRWDGSSKLAEGAKWKSFPSAAASWRISEENFLKTVDVLSNLKLRLSYGLSGNNNVDAYSTQIYASRKMYYDFYGTLSNGFAPSGLSNTRLTWETTREFNVGLDYGFWGNRISGSIDWYDKLSKDLLMDLKLPAENGFDEMKDNVGSVRNTGIELSLHTVNIKTADFTWETSFDFAKNKNKIEELFGKKEDYVANKWFIGQPINVNYTYVANGVWQESERDLAVKYGQLPGQLRVVDFTPDELDSQGNPYNDATDKRIIGSPDPDWTGSFSTRISFKGFDLSASVITKQGIQVYSNFHAEFCNLSDRGRNKLRMNYYMQENDITEANYSNEIPQPGNEGDYYKVEGVGYYKDASFVKVKNINMGYTFSRKITDSLKLKSLRVYMNILNPFVWTAYEGFDPEWASATFGQDGISSVTCQFGVNIQF